MDERKIVKIGFKKTVWTLHRGSYIQARNGIVSFQRDVVMVLQGICSCKKRRFKISLRGSKEVWWMTTSHHDASDFTNIQNCIAQEVMGSGERK